ncbi:hypothetical protein CONPUDRAFT_162111 [Coniophora puteana RWD-64-598 SS2]|uniref:Uncharacterized protein n=1 Tax=Coniophora puteana (strain RWD-64-598) TaxID=741705 RepID=A0A5M3N035_CONPW|nr:uncharacterized protein CONPUDRAFT_162111 [Coniophora puteana RWD-64-598 SS2]EIW84760.1 hypothetical protein CONPUDRAFT_162111 [Coniophora puteana RWD-64-598 SS2]
MNGFSEQAVRSSFHAPEPQRSEILKKAFARLVNPREDLGFIYNYTTAIKHELKGNSARFSPFANACIKAGLVSTMIAIARQEYPGPHEPQERYKSQHNALWALCALMRTGNLSERRSLLDAMLQEGVIDVCLKLLGHHLCLMRQVSINTFRLLAGESFLGERVSPSTAADIIEGVCSYSLTGPDHAIAQMRDSSTIWQSQMFMDSPFVPPDFSLKYAPRFYAVTQESALWTAHGLLCTSSPQSRSFCLDILKKKPHVLDLLFDCAILSREAWYPETQTDSVACEVLTLIFQWPMHIIPGFANPSDKAFKTQEWKAMSQAMTIFTSRQGWVDRLIEVWMHIQEEDVLKVQRFFSTVERDYGASVPPDEQAFARLFEYRGISLISTLRLIVTLTHAADICGITNVQIESLLHIAYLGCRKVDTSKDTDDPMNAMEHAHEIFRSPIWTHFTNSTAEYPAPVATEAVLGPLALVRMYAVLAQRKALDGIQALKKAPIGLASSTSLRQVQQITHPAVVRRVVKISQDRVRVRLEEGRKRLKNRRDNGDDINHACAVFMSAAELAAALISLDTHTEGVYAADIRGARKQLVIALGNASQMALNLKQYQRAFHLASSAVSATENIPDEEGLDPEVKAKNTRRVELANDGLQLV